MTRSQFNFDIVEKQVSVLTENKKVYQSLMEPLLAVGYPTMELDVSDAMKQIKAMGRTDRGVWVAKWYRLDLARRYRLEDLEKKWSRHLPNYNGDGDISEFREFLKKWFSDYAELVQKDSDKYSASFDSIEWKDQSIDVMRDELDHAVSELGAKIIKDSTIIPHVLEVHPGAEMLVAVPGTNWEWWNLDVEHCEVESDAMGHCGGEDGNTTIISLRDNVEPGKWQRPLLTFSMTENGLLVEMKGRGNKKPAPRYHQAVVELLKSDHVRGILGGGYEPEKNFSMNDLEPDIRKQLFNMNPGLMFRDATEMDLMEPANLEIFNRSLWGVGLDKIHGVREVKRFADGDLVILALCEYSSWEEFGNHMDCPEFGEWDKFMKNEYDGGKKHPHPWDMKQYLNYLITLVRQHLTLENASLEEDENGKIYLCYTLDQLLRKLEDNEYSLSRVGEDGWDFYEDGMDDLDGDDFPSPEVYELIHSGSDSALNEMRMLAGVK